MVSNLEEAMGAISAAQEKATESGQMIAAAHTKAEEAQATLKEATEKAEAAAVEAEAAATELANALEKLGGVAGDGLAAQRWCTDFGAEMSEGLGVDAGLVVGLHKAAMVAGDVINRAEGYGTKVEEVSGQGETFLENIEAVTSSAGTATDQAASMGTLIEESGTLSEGLVSALSDLRGALGELS